MYLFLNEQKFAERDLRGMVSTWSCRLHCIL